LLDFECSDLCDQIKKAAITVLLDKIDFAQDPRNGIRAQAFLKLD
jgi:hypothetical protein